MFTQSILNRAKTVSVVGLVLMSCLSSSGGWANDADPIDGWEPTPVDGGVCDQTLETMRQAFRTAQADLADGTIKEAAMVLLDGLNITVQEDVDGTHESMPNAMRVVYKGRHIIGKLIKSTKERHLSEEMQSQILFLVADQVYRMVFSAYRFLDERHWHEYRDIDRFVNSCREDGDYNGPRPDITYFTSSLKLAKGFLELGLQEGQVLADNVVELKVSKTIAEVSQELLLENIFRRKFCPAIHELGSLITNLSSNGMLDPDAIGGRSLHHKVELLHDSVRRAVSLISQAEYGVPCGSCSGERQVERQVERSVERQVERREGSFEKYGNY